MRSRQWTCELRQRLVETLSDVAGKPEDSVESEEAFLQKVWQIVEDYVRLRFPEQSGLSNEEKWTSFVLPAKRNYVSLVKTEPAFNGGKFSEKTKLRRRDGFGFTDTRMKRSQVLGEADYCLLCHQREKDSCTKGFIEKDGKTFKKIR